MSHFVAYILQFQEIIVYKIPPGGEGVYSQPKVYENITSMSEKSTYLKETQRCKQGKNSKLLVHNFRKISQRFPTAVLVVFYAMILVR